jgi:hypothetical protein
VEQGRDHRAEHERGERGPAVGGDRLVEVGVGAALRAIEGFVGQIVGHVHRDLQRVRGHPTAPGDVTAEPQAERETIDPQYSVRSSADVEYYYDPRKGVGVTMWDTPVQAAPLTWTGTYTP